MKGTPIYMSPEVLQEMKYTPACDVYAFSLITYEILSGQKPFNDLNFSQLALKVGIKGFRPKLNKSIPKSFRNLLEMCWDQKPECRPTMNEVVDMLKNDETFITETIDQQKFYDYVDYIDNYKSSFELNRTFHFDDFINKNNKNNSFEKIKIIEEDEETTNKKDNHEENIITKDIYRAIFGQMHFLNFYYYIINRGFELRSRGYGPASYQFGLHWFLVI